MNRQDKLELMWDTFVHDDVGFAEQVYADGSGSLEQGTHFFRQTTGTCTHLPKCRVKSTCDHYVPVIFTKDHLATHLTGRKTYAPYQTKDGMVKWVCFDIDGYDADDEDIHTQVKTLARLIYKEFGPHHCLVEASGSKGYHVWVFFSTPISIEKAFAFGHQLATQVEPLKDINIEVYPKQYTNKVFGNTVKLPLGIHQKTGKRCLFVNAFFEPFVNQWAVLANVEKVSSEWVEENVEVKEWEQKPQREYVRYTPQCLEDIMKDGASEGLRDEAAFRLSSYLDNKGIPEDLAHVMMDKWNVKNHPPLDDVVLEQKVYQGYQGSYGFYPCHLPSFDRHCHSTCVFFAKKVERRWFTKDKSPIGILSSD